jgi:hypothetical protein
MESYEELSGRGFRQIQRFLVVTQTTSAVLAGAVLRIAASAALPKFFSDGALRICGGVIFVFDNSGAFTSLSLEEIDAGIQTAAARGIVTIQSIMGPMDIAGGGFQLPDSFLYGTDGLELGLQPWSLNIGATIKNGGASSQTAGIGVQALLEIWQPKP